MMQTALLLRKKRSLFISEPVWTVLINISSNSHSKILYVFLKETKILWHLQMLYGLQSVPSGVFGKGSHFAIFCANRRWPLQQFYHRTTVIDASRLSVFERAS